MPKKARTPSPDDTRSPDGPGFLVKRLELEQFRCFEKLSIELDRSSRLGGHWTCVVGVNGSGKSSVLQALCLALLAAPDIHQLGFVRLTRMRRLRIDQRGAQRPSSKITVGVSGDSLGFSEVEVKLGPDSSSIESDDLWQRIGKHVLLSYGTSRNLSGYRDGRYDNLNQRMQRQMTLFDPLAQIPAAEVLLASAYRGTDEAADKLFRRLVSLVFGEDVRMFPSWPLRFVVERQSIMDAVDLPDGFRSSVAWLADLCVAWSETNPEDAESGDPAKIEATVLIDEIDLHLHPSLQRILVPNLRKALPRVQWVVTSHSPLVLSSFASEELVVLDRREPGGVRQLDRQILGFSMDQIYQWLMETPATSAEMEGQLAEAASGRDKELAELLEMTPEIGTDEARERVRRRADLLKHLKS